MQEQDLERITNHVRRKQEYTYLSQQFIRSAIDQYIKAKPKREHEEKLIVKYVRAQARDVYGMYQIRAHTRQHLLEIRDMESLLKTHLSTKERFAVYEELYEKLSSMVNLDSVMDIACGLNPLTFHLMPNHPSYVVASEMSDAETTFLAECFSTFDILGETVALDASKDYAQISALRHCTTCFLFKALDVLEKQHRNGTLELLKAIPADHIVVSFTTVNIKQKRLRNIRREWFERMCEKLAFPITHQFEMGNELFYVVKKR